MLIVAFQSIRLHKRNEKSEKEVACNIETIHVGSKQAKEMQNGRKEEKETNEPARIFAH